MVWTTDKSGERVEAVVIKTSTTPVPSDFQLRKVVLADGRAITASPGHPTAEGQPLGDYQNGDTIDSSVIISIENVTYNERATFDILPAGTTGHYWANGILLGSTLVK